MCTGTAIPVTFATCIAYVGLAGCRANHLQSFAASIDHDAAPRAIYVGAAGQAMTFDADAFHTLVWAKFWVP